MRCSQDSKVWSDVQGLGLPAFTGSTSQSERPPLINGLVSWSIALRASFRITNARPYCLVPGSLCFPGGTSFSFFRNTDSITYLSGKVNVFDTILAQDSSLDRHICISQSASRAVSFIARLYKLRTSSGSAISFITSAFGS